MSINTMKVIIQVPIFKIFNKINKNKASLTYKILTFDIDFQKATKKIINNEINFRENTN